MTGTAPMRDAVRLRTPARRARRGDAQEQGQLDPVRRRGRADRRRRHALDVRVGESRRRTSASATAPATRSCAASSCRSGTRTASSSPTRGSTAGRRIRPMAPTRRARCSTAGSLSRLDDLVGEVRDGPRRVRRAGSGTRHRDVRRRSLELVRPSQPASVLEGRARRRQARRLRDAARGADHARAAAGADRAARRRRDLGQPRRSGGLRRSRTACTWPDVPAGPPAARDPAVEAAVELARRTVALGRTHARRVGVRTRQPLRRVQREAARWAARGAQPRRRPSPTSCEPRSSTSSMSASWSCIPDESEMVERTLYPLLPIIGPRHGKRRRSGHGRRAQRRLGAAATNGTVDGRRRHAPARRVRADGPRAARSRGGRGRRPAGGARHRASTTSWRPRAWRGRWRTDSRPCARPPATRSATGSGWRSDAAQRTAGARAGRQHLRWLLERAAWPTDAAVGARQSHVHRTPALSGRSGSSGEVDASWRVRRARRPSSVRLEWR